MDNKAFFKKAVESFQARQPGYAVFAEVVWNNVENNKPLSAGLKQFAGLMLVGYTNENGPQTFSQALEVARELGIVVELVSWANSCINVAQQIKKTPPEGGV